MASDIATSITKQSGSHFYYSFNFLPREKRDAIYTVYAFCKRTDDIVDGDGSLLVKKKNLDRWRIELEKSVNGGSSLSLLNKLGTTAHKFNIPFDHFFELIRGVEMDLEKNRYVTFNELYTYCYRVASTVGLMCAEIFSYTKEQTRQYAINLGIALQLTNIVRDIKSDLIRNRIYIPQEDLTKFNYTEHDLKNHIYNEPFQKLMQHQVERARNYYKKANEHLAPEDRKGFLAARIMEKIYYSLLKKIERNRYNIFSKKTRVHKAYQFGIAVAVWLRHKVIPLK